MEGYGTSTFGMVTTEGYFEIPMDYTLSCRSDSDNSDMGARSDACGGGTAICAGVYGAHRLMSI